MIINPEQITKTGLYPISGTNLDSHEAVMKGNATIQIINNTGVQARPKFKLKLKIYPRGSANFATNQYKAYVNYAVTEQNGSCDNAIIKGNFGIENSKPFDECTKNNCGTGWANSPWITFDTYNSITKANTADGFSDITSENSKSVSFDAGPYVTTTHVYKVCAWLDSSYTFTNTGTNVTDPLQNATFIVTWSEDSEVSQVRVS